MLTKKEREEIAERFKNCKEKDLYPDYDVFYECLFGRPVPDVSKTLVSEDCAAITARLLDLCGTSNMLELPRDKDGEVIHIGDTVWCDGDKCQVASIRYDTSGLFGVEVYIRSAVEMFRAFWRSPKTVTHTEPISDHESIARAIEDIVYRLNDAAASLKLQDIAMELRKLGDDND